MRTRLALIFLTALMSLAPAAASAGPIVLSDNFNDGNTNGWSFDALAWPGTTTGNWRVEFGELVQNAGGDHYKALVEDLVLSSQRIETSMNVDPYGYGGVTVWYQDARHWVDVWSYPGYGRMEVYEFNDGVANNVVYDFAYPGGVWNRLRVDADSKAGTLNVYMDDVFLFTHEITVAERTGLSGLNSGNYGGSFDDFSLTTDDYCYPFPGGGHTGGCFPGPHPFPGHVPDPGSTLLLLGMSLVGLGAWRKRWQ